MAGERILIVEDEFLIRATLADMLEDAGFEVVAADNGEEALDVMRADGGIALLMTDMGLGAGMDGVTLAAAARGLRGGLPVVFVTGRPDLAPLSGPDHTAVVAKPYTMSDVTTAVTRLLTLPV